MRRNTQLCVALAAMQLFGVVLPAQGQHHAAPVGTTQQAQMQQHMNMQGLIQRMQAMMQRSQAMSAQLNEQMLQMPAGQMSAQHHAMQQMSDHIATVSGHLKDLMGQMDTLMRDDKVMRTAAARHDMDEMHRQMGTTTTSMEKMLQVMDHMNKRMAGAPPR